MAKVRISNLTEIKPLSGDDTVIALATTDANSERKVLWQVHELVKRLEEARHLVSAYRDSLPPKPAMYVQCTGFLERTPEVKL